MVWIKLWVWNDNKTSSVLSDSILIPCSWMRSTGNLSHVQCVHCELYLCFLSSYQHWWKRQRTLLTMFKKGEEERTSVDHFVWSSHWNGQTAWIPAKHITEHRKHMRQKSCKRKKKKKMMVIFIMSEWLPFLLFFYLISFDSVLEFISVDWAWNCIADLTW